MRGSQLRSGDALSDNVVSLDGPRENRQRTQDLATIAAISLRENRDGGIDYRIDAIDAVNALPMLMALMQISARILEIYRGRDVG